MKLLSLRKETPDALSAGSPAEGGEDICIEKSEASLSAGEVASKKRPKKWIVIAALILVAVILALSMRSCAGRASQMESKYTYATAERRDITDTLTGSGALEPAESYTVTTLISGDILSADFMEGDVVSKGDVLYEIDSSDAATSIERSELSLAQSKRTYDNKADSIADLTILAPISGTITGISVETGDMVVAQTVVASIQNTSTLTLTEYYSDEYAGQIYVGMPATVSVSDQMLSLDGKVKEVLSQKRNSSTGISCFSVIVQVSNPGSLVPGTDATCWLSTSSGTIYPSITDEDGLDALESTKVYTKVSGNVSAIRVKNNETVYAGQSLMQLISDTLNDDVQNASDSLTDAELSLQSQYDSLSDYTIAAPIDGTIIDKYYKQGEKSESNKALCIIYDLSHLTLTLNVDELDISQVSVGQKATIKADAVPDNDYQGVITKVGINGTTTSGVTTYPVSIRIDKPEGLLPGMNVDVTIIVNESKNALSIPADAVEHGGRVLVKTEDKSINDSAPEGFKYIQVKIGSSDDNYVEIISGLTDGETVAYILDTPSGSNPMEQMPFGQGDAGGNGNTGGVNSAGGNTP